ncbi:cupin domain-containing protein [Rhizobium terrae]|uniref:hypothetical protein n=1 Tax=Rhizobium terrae TaxID=2171756 RepID=UPI000E3C7DF2|nr:hypothetical protein [Rhizobium terrae]
MYDKSDPRSSLAAAEKKAAPPPARFAGTEYGRFYETAPQIDDASGRTWITRGQNFVIAYSDCRAGAVFAREGQLDEYALIVPDAGTSVEITTEAGTETVPGYSVAFIPPGKTVVRVLAAGRIVRLFTPKSEDLASLASNAGNFAEPHPTVPPFVAWPEPPGGLKLRWYSLDVPVEPGRFGKIFRCTTFMVNYLDPRIGPRDRTKVSPHHHDDFEQCSLALDGSFTHHIRWPWTTDMTIWREDEHALCLSPSVCVIPPPAIHTSTAEDLGLNQLVDIFAPPRLDFSSKPGWVLNADDYPMP